MDFVLVVPLILALLTTGQSYTTVANNSCYTKCPAGYHKSGDCEDSSAPHRCKMCSHGTFTEIANIRTECLRCSWCSSSEEEIVPCSFNRNVVCGCKKGYYNANPGSHMRDCKQCTCDHCQGTVKTESQRMCMDYCTSCLNNPTCKKKCPPTIPPGPPTTPPTTPSKTPSTTLPKTPSTTPPKTPSKTPSTTPPKTPSKTPSTTPPKTPSKTPSTSPSPPKVNQIPWLFLVGVVVTFLVLFWLLLFFTRNPLRFPDRCPCWRLNKAQEVPVEDPKLNEQHSHQSRCSTTLTLNISEETPMMTLSQSPATPDPACVGPVLPDAEHKAARQEEQSGHWPAIVLYAVIKEVPLRRWKEFLRLLSVADQQLERVELEAGLGLGSMERQYQMLRLWSQRASSSMNDIFSALHYMDLSGCAQLLQESLEKLPWRPELKQGCTDNGAMQDS